MNILVAMPTYEEHETRLKKACPEAAFTFLHGNRPEREQLENAEIIVGNISFDDLQYCMNLKFLQLSMAGSDSFAGRVPESVLLANSSGAYGLAISEHMLGMLLMLTKKLYLYRDNQNEGVWHDEGNVPKDARASEHTIWASEGQCGPALNTWTKCTRSMSLIRCFRVRMWSHLRCPTAMQAGIS